MTFVPLRSCRCASQPPMKTGRPSLDPSSCGSPSIPIPPATMSTPAHILGISAPSSLRSPSRRRNSSVIPFISVLFWFISLSISSDENHLQEVNILMTTSPPCFIPTPPIRPRSSTPRIICSGFWDCHSRTPGESRLLRRAGERRVHRREGRSIQRSHL